MAHVGMLLSEKDSIVYPRALSPELRIMNPRHVHPVPDYTGATKEERVERMQQIIRDLPRARLRLRLRRLRLHGRGRRVRARARGGGPHASSARARTRRRAAGAKDEAKRTAIENAGLGDARHRTTPPTRTLLRKYPDRAALDAAREGAPARRAGARRRAAGRCPSWPSAVLEASYRKQRRPLHDRRARRDAAPRSGAPADASSPAGASA